MAVKCFMIQVVKIFFLVFRALTLNCQIKDDNIHKRKSILSSRNKTIEVPLVYKPAFLNELFYTLDNMFVILDGTDGSLCNRSHLSLGNGWFYLIKS